VSAPSFFLRRYHADDETAAIEVWRRTWQVAYPHIDFAARLDWWRERWRKELVPITQIVVVEISGALSGFVTVDAATGYLDQIVVAPEAWGCGIAHVLVAEAKRIAPAGLDLFVNEDNARAIRFYEKNGFVRAGAGTHSLSGAPTCRMIWRP